MRIHHLTLAASLAAFSVLCLVAQDAQKPPATAGPTTDGFLLPNGWKLCPAGEHLVLSDLPLNIVLLPGGKEALASQDVYQSWFGLAVSPDARRVWWAGGAGIVHEQGLKDGKLTRTSEPEPKLPSKKNPQELAEAFKKTGFNSGLTFDAKHDRLYALDIIDQKESGQKRSSIHSRRPSP